MLVPLTLKQFHSMQKLQRLQPELKAIQTKYKEDKQRQQQEMMKFYKENKVNPFASCLPLVAQLPVFISLFYMLRKDLRRRHLPGGPARIPPRMRRHHVALQRRGADHGRADHGGAGFLFIHDLTNKATGVVAGRADPALRRHPARLDA